MRFPSITITLASFQKVEKMSEFFSQGKDFTKARVSELFMSAGSCTGCIYDKGGAGFKEIGLVFSVSGDFSDAVKLYEATGAEAILSSGGSSDGGRYPPQSGEIVGIFKTAEGRNERRLWLKTVIACAWSVRILFAGLVL